MNGATCSMLPKTLMPVMCVNYSRMLSQLSSAPLQHVRPARSNGRLNDALHGPAAEAIFEADHVSDHLLSILDRSAKDRVLWAARKAIGTSDYSERSLTSTLAFLRAHGLAIAIEALPPGSGWRAVLRRLKADLGRARGPVPSFQPPEGWRRIETMAELWDVGAAMKNCVSSLRAGGEDYMRQFMSGTAVFLVSDGPPTMLASIENVGPSLWVLGEMTTLGYQIDFFGTSDAFRAVLAAKLAEAGDTLMDQLPFQAMSSIARQADHKAVEADLVEIEDAA
jgi:hypothetical protein